MDKQEYINNRAKDIEQILIDKKLNNFFNQIFALKVGATFEKRFSEDYLWVNTLFLLTKGALILGTEKSAIALRAFRIAGEIYENLSIISKAYDREFAKILSALSYDVAGYQANAKCLVDDFFETGFSPYILSEEAPSQELALENKVVELLILFLHKNISSAYQNIIDQKELLRSPPLNTRIDFVAFIEGLEVWFKNILDGDNDIDNAEKLLFESYESFLLSGNVLLSQLLYILLARIKQYKKKNIWQILRENNKLPDFIWNSYARLLTNNIYENNRIIPSQLRNSIFEFWESQLEAFRKGILNTENSYVLQMPTSAGKTLIAEIAIIDTLSKNLDSKCIYIAPFRALTTEIEETLSNRLNKLGFVVSSVTGSYEIDEFQDFWINEANVLVATPEKIDLLLRMRPEFFENVGLIVIDEGHIIGNRDERSALLEFLIIRLKRKFRNTNVRFLFISAVMPELDAKQFAIWLCRDESYLVRSPIVEFNEEWQPTRRLLGKFIWGEGDSGSVIFPKRNILSMPDAETQDPFVPNIIRVTKYKDYTPKEKREKFVFFPKKDRKADTAVDLAYKLSSEGPILIFCTMPRLATAIGDAFLELLRLKENEVGFSCPDYFRENVDKESSVVAEKWLDPESTITKCLKRGVGIHYGPLADPVRKAIERDFRERKLRVLIATNTVIQGLNFPIKTVIIHSVNRNKEYLGVRDFWNIIGRAGRAGKETEGQIIFLVSSQRDEELFQNYSDKSKMDKIKSILLLLLELRFSQETIDEYLKYFIEPSLLEIVMEEVINTPDEAKIEEILGDSLCKIQAVDIDMAPLKHGMGKIVSNFLNTIGDPNLRAVYAKTGMHLESCRRISDLILSNLDELRTAVQNNDYLNVFKVAMQAIVTLDEMSSSSEAFKDISDYYASFWAFIEKWIQGNDISTLKIEWANIFRNSKIETGMNAFIEEFLYYRYPWGISVFLLILIYHLGIEKYDDLPNEIKNLPSFVKYGLNDLCACWAKSIGVFNRESSMVLSSLYKSSGNIINFVTFLKWFSNLSYEELKGASLAEYDLINILNLGQKINVERWASHEEDFKSEFYVKGIPYEESRKVISKQVGLNEPIQLQREYDNKFDSFAIKIMVRGIQLGYVPREISKKISIQIDVNRKKFSGKIIAIDKLLDYNRISVEIIPA